MTKTIILFIVISALFTNGIMAGVPEEDSLALVALYNSTDGPNWTDNTNWLQPDQPLSFWHGVTVVDDSIISVNLLRNNLTGVIPDDIGELQSLETLVLNYNNLTGSIPKTIGNLVNLKTLFLNDNALSDTIPKEIGNLHKLESLSLRINDLEGEIPAEIFNLTALTSLNLASNMLSGSIHENIGQLVNLEYIDIRSNQLSGSLPWEIGNLTGLLSLYINHNAFTGSIPESIGNLNKLENLDIRSNEFSGPIPKEMGNMDSLFNFSAYANHLTGNIPPEIGNLTKLVFLDLHENELTGSIPSSIGNLTRLITLDLGHNELEGAIPEEIVNLTKLRRFILSDNQLTGVIPSGIGNLHDIWQFNVSYNQLEGNIPPGIGDIDSLETLRLNDNLLTGDLPEEIGNLHKLEYLVIDRNELTGNLPEGLGNNENLVSIFASSNNLSGPIPEGLKNLPNLINLYLDENRFTFADLEPLAGMDIDNFYYHNQQPLSLNTPQINKSNGESLNIDILDLSTTDLEATHNQYQWVINGIQTGDYAEESILTISELAATDSGYYYCKINNTDFPELTLYSDTVKLVIDGPVDIHLSQASIDENVPEGSIVGTLSADDPDQAEGHIFLLCTGDGINDTDNNLFSIDGSDLLINTSPDFETKDTYLIRVVAIDEDSKRLEKSFVITITDVEEFTGILPGENIDVHVYPIPASDYICVDLPEKGKQFTYQLFALDGALMRSGIASEDFQISLAGYAAGIYHVKIIYADSYYNCKIIKQRQQK